MVGRDNMVRLDAPEVGQRIAMDDVGRAVVEMPPVARSLAEASGHRIAELLLWPSHAELQN